MDKAECVVVYPSVKKAAFVVRWKLWSRRNDLPHGSKLHGTLERSRDDGA